MAQFHRHPQIGKRQELYESIHPETKHATGKELADKRWHATDKLSTASFSADTAAKTKKSKMELKKIPVKKIKTGVAKHRTDLGEDGEMRELAENIRSVGLINPITVRPDDGGYEIIAGERRWLAHKAAQMMDVLAIVRDASDEESQLIAISENIKRKQLTDIERENAVGRLWDSGKFRNHEKLADFLGVSHSTVSDIIEAGAARKKLRVTRQNITTSDLAETSSLNDGVRGVVLEKKSRGENGWGA